MACVALLVPTTAPQAGGADQLAMLLSPSERPDVLGGERNPGNISGPVVYVEIKDLLFIPKDLVIPPGTTVVWVNKDQTAHTSTEENFEISASQQRPGVWNSFSLSPGESFARRFDEPGMSRYFCRIHPSTTGTVTVDRSVPSAP